MLRIFQEILLLVRWTIQKIIICPSFRSVSSSNVQSSRSVSTSNSTHDFSVSIPPLAPPEPRRLGRNRQVPQRFGDWVYQHSVEDQDTMGILFGFIIV